MATCRKCGARAKRRRAGVFECVRHGFLPGDYNMDRAGSPQRRAEIQGPPKPGLVPFVIVGTAADRPARAKGSIAP